MKTRDYQFPFEKLLVWTKSRELVKDLYLITKSYPRDELFGLTNQMRRAAISVKSNIAEGASRMTARDRSNFYQISYSSLNELISQLYTSYDLGYISEQQLNILRTQAKEISIYLIRLRKSELSKPPPR